MESYSRMNVTIMDTERDTVGEKVIKMTTEMTIKLQEMPTSTVNAITVEKEATRLLVVGRGKKKRKTMTSETSF